MSEADPFARQRRLAEVGDAGQARIERAEVRLSAHEPGAIVGMSYLLRAGTRAVSLHVKPSVESTAFPHAGAFRFAVTRELGAGAWQALAALRRALEISA
jgi:hypothetical protein